MTALPAVAARGVVVVAMGDAVEASWALARGVYADERLRPASLDDATARVLAGEAPRAGASAAVVRMAERRRGLRGGEASSRDALDAVAREVGASTVALVEVPAGQPPRIWMFQGGAFDSTPLAADPGPLLGWGQALATLRGRMPSASVLSGEKEPAASSTSWLRSGWFWGALGAAAGGALLVWALTRDTGGVNPTPLRARFVDR